jgi:hypothetical protein
VHLYPASLVIIAAVLLPNLLYLRFPPKNANTYGKPRDSLAFTVVERAGQVSCFLLPLFFPLSFVGTIVAAAWAVMALSLGLYYAGWIRFFARDRDYALLFMPMIGIPVPMAISPVVLFLVSSLVLGSIWQAFAAIVLGIGHVTITAREYLRVTGSRELLT